MTERLSLTSENVLQRRLDELRLLFPEVFIEGKIDFERLRAALGDAIDVDRERFGLTWAGKADAIRSIQSQSTGTLKPVPEESVNFDTSQNLIIEGDNLEVLKLLQKSYHNKVKMIYIDPPYNTGHEFIYPDNFSEGTEAYLRYSGQLNGDGTRTSTNTETDGRYHSKWLSMMYPRLFLARNLLKDDGVIFVSIDDHEVQHLRMIMDEIFGGENFVATVIWQKVFSPKNTARQFSEDHDYVIVYAKNAHQWEPQLLPRTEAMESRYANPDNDPRGPWMSSDLTARNYYSEGTYAVTCPSGREIAGPPSGRYWLVSKEKFLEFDKDQRIYWGADGNNMPRLKRFLSEVKAGVVPQTLWKYEDVGHTQEAKKELLSRVTFASSDSVFDTPKPTRLIERMLRIATSANANDIVLDFFAGSGSTGDAVLKLNHEDGGNRKFVLVQLPEPTGYDDYPTIADICKERVRQAINEIDSSAGDAGIGYRFLRFTSSNFKIWDAAQAGSNQESLTHQLRLFADHTRPEAKQLDILYEIILKAGLPLDIKTEELFLTGQAIWRVGGRRLLICLAEVITQEIVQAMIDLRPAEAVCLDNAFGGNDQLKTNAALQMASQGIRFRTV